MKQSTNFIYLKYKCTVEKEFNGNTICLLKFWNNYYYFTNLDLVKRKDYWLKDLNIYFFMGLRI